jgi:hypothetical protein
MIDSTILGMTVEIPEGIVGTPLEVVAVVKYLDEDGDLCYGTVCTDGVSKVEAIGMMTWASDMIRFGSADA